MHVFTCVALLTLLGCHDSPAGDLAPPSDGVTDDSAAPTNIGDGDVEVSTVKQVMPDGFASADLWYGQEDPWNSDATRIMYFEDDNVLDPDGEYGLGLVWARVADIESWTTVAEYKASRHALDRYPYRYAAQLEWSPFEGEENIVYAARLADHMIVKIDVDSGDVEPIVSYDPGDGDAPTPLLRRWTLDNHLIVMLDGADDLSPWVRGVYEVDVQARTRTYWGPPDTMDYWALPTSDRIRWPYVVSHHGSFSPDHTLAVGSDNTIKETTDYSLVATVAPITKPYASSINHTTWRASQAWFVVDDLGESYNTAIYSSSPNIDNFAIHQCFVDGHCRPLLVTRSAQDYNQYPVNWPTSPIATVRKDGRQLVYTTTNGMYSQTDHDNYGVEPWSHRLLFLANLVPATDP